MNYDKVWRTFGNFEVTAYADGSDAKHFIINQLDVTSIRTSPPNTKGN